MSVRSPLVLAHWRAIFAEHRRSGLSITAFCKSRKIVKSSFHRWRSTLEQLDPARVKPKLSPSFVPVRVVPEVVGVVEVLLPSGIQLRVPLNADASQIARLVKAVAAC